MRAMKTICDNKPEAVRKALAVKAGRYSMEKATEGLEKALEAVVKKRGRRSDIGATA